MKKLRERFTPKDLMGWLTIQTVVLLGAAVLSFIVVELLADALFGPREQGNTLILALVMILPMAVLMVIVHSTYLDGKVLFYREPSVYGPKAGDGYVMNFDNPEWVSLLDQALGNFSVSFLSE